LTLWNSEIAENKYVRHFLVRVRGTLLVRGTETFNELNRAGRAIS